jgi:hypothetical protein
MTVYSFWLVLLVARHFCWPGSERVVLLSGALHIVEHDTEYLVFSLEHPVFL